MKPFVLWKEYQHQRDRSLAQDSMHLCAAHQFGLAASLHLLPQFPTSTQARTWRPLPHLAAIHRCSQIRTLCLDNVIRNRHFLDSLILVASSCQRCYSSLDNSLLLESFHICSHLFIRTTSMWDFILSLLLVMLRLKSMAFLGPHSHTCWDAKCTDSGTEHTYHNILTQQKHWWPTYSCEQSVKETKHNQYNTQPQTARTRSITEQLSHFFPNFNWGPPRGKNTNLTKLTA